MPLTRSEVSQLYITLFGRSSEGAGNEFWRASASSLEDGATKMLATQAAKDYFGTSMDDNRAFIEYIYLNTLGKTYEDDPGGIEFWTQSLEQGTDRGTVVASLIDAVGQYEKSTDPVTKAAYDRFMNRAGLSDTVSTTLDGTNLDASDTQLMNMYAGLITCVNHLPESLNASLALTDIIPQNASEQTAEAIRLINNMTENMGSMLAGSGAADTLGNVSDYLGSVSDMLAQAEQGVNPEELLIAVDEVVENTRAQPSVLDDPQSTAQSTVADVSPESNLQADWSLLMPRVTYPYALYVSDGTGDGSGDVELSAGSTSARIYVSPAQDEAVVQSGNEVYSIQDVTTDPLRIADNVSSGYDNWVTVSDITLITDANSDRYSALVTDGSRAGSFVVADMDDYTSSYRNIIDPDQGVIWSDRYTAPYGDELFLTRVSTSGINSDIIKDINPGAESSIRILNSVDYSIVMQDGTLLFRATDGEHGYEPWISDGTASGTFMLADIRSGELNSDPAGFARFGDRAAFAVTTPDYGRELMVTDGTQSGTHLLDFNEGNLSSLPYVLGESGGKLYVETRIDVEKYIFSVESSLDYTLTQIDASAESLGWGNDIVYFAHSDAEHGEELWALDPENDNFYMVKDILSGTGSSLPEDVVLINDHLLFSAYASATSKALFVSDGTEAGTVEIGSGTPDKIEQFGDIIMYANSDGVHSLDLSESIPAARTLVNGFSGDEKDLQSDQDQIYFIDDAQTFYTANVQGLEVKALLDEVVGFKVVAEDALYLIQEKNYQTSLWFSDGSEEGTCLVTDLTGEAQDYDIGSAVAIKTDTLLDAGA